MPMPFSTEALGRGEVVEIDEFYCVLVTPGNNCAQGTEEIESLEFVVHE